MTLVEFSLPWEKISIINYGFISKEFSFRIVRGINHMKSRARLTSVSVNSATSSYVMAE